MKYLIHTTIAVLVVFAFTIESAAALPSSEPEPDNAVSFLLHEDSKIVVEGTSNVRDWSMEVTEVDGSFALQQVQSSSNSDALRFDRVQVRIPVEGLLSGQGKMDSKAHKTLKKDSYPTIHFDADQTEVVSTSGETMTIRSEGTMIVAGQQHEIALELEGTRRDDGSLHFQGTKDLTFSELGLDRPTAMLGALKVADDFAIAFDVVLVEES